MTDTIWVGDREYIPAGADLFWQKLERGEPLEGFYFQEKIVWQEESYSFANKVSIRNCYFDAPVKWQYCTFQERVVFEKVHFAKGVSFGPTRSSLKNIQEGHLREACHFAKELIFRDCHIEKGLDLVGVHVGEKLLLDRCHWDILTVGRSRIENFELIGGEGGEFLGFELSGEALLVRNWKLTGQLFFKRSQWQNVSVTDCQLEGPSEWELCEVQDWEWTNVEGAKGGFRFFSCRRWYWRYCLWKEKVTVEHPQCEKGFSIIDTTLFKGLSLQNGSFEGYFNLNNSLLQGKCHISNSEFERNASLAGSVFCEDLALTKNIFRGECSLVGVLCQKKLTLRFSTFLARTTLSSARIEGDLSAYRTSFEGPTYFLGTLFQDASFSNATFSDQVFFCFDRHTLTERKRLKISSSQEPSLAFVSIFRGTANFTNTLFYKRAVFEGVHFLGPAQFCHAYFGEEACFQESVFAQEANFEGVYCGTELNFSYALFHGYACFDEANINRRLNFRGSVFRSGLSFYHSIIDVIVVEQEQVADKLIYEGKVPGKESLRSYHRVKEEYLILKESFQQRGKLQEEDWAYYQYRVSDRKERTLRAWCSLLGKENPEGKTRALAHRDQYDTILEGAQKKLKECDKKYQQLEERKQPSPKLKEQIRTSIVEQQIAFQKFHCESAKAQLHQRQQLIERDKQWAEYVLEERKRPWGKVYALWQLCVSFFWCLVDWSTGYGVKPFRIGFVAAFLILLYTGLYLIPFLPTLSQQGASFLLDTLNFSALVFVTEVQEHPVLQQGTWMEFLVVSEAFLGLFFMALFVGCYTRKIIR